MGTNDIFENLVNKVNDFEDFDIILSEKKSIIGYFSNAKNLGLESKLFDLLDNSLINCLKSEINIKTNVIFARILSISSQFNDYCSESETKLINIKKDEINTNILKVCNHLENFEFESGLKCLKESRNWLGIGNENLTLLYDSCVKILIKNCTKTIYESIVFEVNNCFPQIAINEWIVAKSPARIDLQGGWTDTPPICYELGGRVINIAVQVNNEKPIGAKARRVDFSEHPLILIKEFDFKRKLITELKLNDIKELYDYNCPDSSGALIKSALICCKIIDIKKKGTTLRQQLNDSINSGLEIELWSDLPQGSGLGTSSILSGCVVAVLWVLLGQKFSKKSLINAVLYVEQLMSTGGGWQDQIGGLIGGLKLGHSSNELPLKIDYKLITMSPYFRIQFEKHLVLIYSGSVRLAKNLLQNVIQNWYIRDQNITYIFNELLTSTDFCLKAFLDEDLKSIGYFLSKYWNLKKNLALNSEPKQVFQFFKKVEPLIFGGSLCGAGGGGFMVLIMKEPNLRKQIISLTQQYLPESQVYECSVDEKGFQLSINGIEYEIPE